MFVQVRLGVEGGYGGKILPGYQYGGKLFIGDIAVGNVLTINQKKFQITRIDNQYTCDTSMGLTLPGGAPLVVVKELTEE